MNGPITALAAKFKFNTFKQQTVTVAAAITPPASNGTDEVGLNVLNNIFVQAPSTNTQPITLKNKSDVAIGGPGIELIAGANYNLPGIKPSDWYVIATSGSQKLNILYSAVVI